MKIEKLWKTADSGTGECPALYAVVDGVGGYVVQGKVLDAATAGQLADLGDGETAVWVPADVLTRLAGAVA